MKIGVLTHNYPRFPGDFSGRFIEALSEELATQGHQVTVLAPWDPAYARQPGDHRVEIRLYRYAPRADWHRLGYMRTMKADLAMRGLTYLLAPGLFVAGAHAVLRWAAEARPDVLHAHWVLPNGFLAALAARRYDIPLVVSIPGSDATVATANPLFRRMARFAFATAGLITANSTALRDVAVSRLGADPAKFDLIAYGVAPDALRPDPTGTAELRQHLGIPPDAFVALAVGRMVYKKGFDHLLRAAALARSESANQRSGEAAKQRSSEAANQRISESANQRSGESANQRISESANQRSGESAKRRSGESADLEKRHAPSAIRHAPSAIRHAPSAIRHAPSAIRHAPSADSLHLVMIGEGDLWAEWQALGHQLGLGDCVHWVGNVPTDRIGVFYNMADVLVMPAVTLPADGLNVTVLDAMSCGKPVIGTAAAGNELAIRDGINGFLLPEGDDLALANALLKLARDPELRARMGRAGRQLIETELGWPVLARRYLAHFARLKRYP